MNRIFKAVWNESSGTWVAASETSKSKTKRASSGAGVTLVKAAVIGGLDSPPGAVVGGVGLGLVLSYVSGYVGSDVVDFGALLVLVLILMVRPNGLFGHAAGRRV